MTIRQPTIGNYIFVYCATSERKLGVNFQKRFIT
jgi:hypothetical protein